MERGEEYIHYHEMGDPDEVKKLAANLVRMITDSSEEIEGYTAITKEDVDFSDCEFTENEVDEFLGIKKLSTKAHFIVGGLTNTMMLGLREVGDDYILRFTYKTDGANSLVAGPDDLLMLKLSNDTIIRASLREVTAGSHDYGTNGISTTTFSGQYGVDSAGFVALSRYPIRKVRVYFSDGYVEEEVRDKRAIKVAHDAHCILAY